MFVKRRRRCCTIVVHDLGSIPVEIRTPRHGDYWCNTKDSHLLLQYKIKINIKIKKQENASK